MRAGRHGRVQQPSQHLQILGLPFRTAAEQMNGRLANRIFRFWFGRQQAGPVEDGLQPTDRLAGVGICIRDQRRERELLAVQRVQQAAQGRELPDFLVLAVGRGNRGDDFAE